MHWPADMFVSLHGLAQRPEYNNTIWQVANDSVQGDRIVVYRAEQGREQHISVRPEKLAPLTLIPVRIAKRLSWKEMLPSIEEQFNWFISTTRRRGSLPLDKWLMLPGAGPNYFQVRAHEKQLPYRKLKKYPSLDGFQLWFHSEWNKATIKLQDSDVFKLCPAQHYWPYCSECGKFLLPPEEHRNSRKHTRRCLEIEDVPP